ncbi:MAG TPA: protein kinase [Thermoanaerobaculia bacterium]|nr:protein kinase [Thermoanaerobaculia bacterium]
MGPYQLLDEIGAGGMGTVYRALDTRLDRAVAIKILPPHRWSDSDFRQRFQREARAISSLNHPNICALYDIGDATAEGATVPYLVMELLEGQTLREKLDAGRLPLRKALTWGAAIAHGLAAAHTKGLVHRDLKPENLFVTRDEHLKILDFGLAKSALLGGSESATALKTQPGLVLGTTHYMSPEQIRGDALDHRSDIFSLGVVLFEMICGRVPFRARSPVETMNAILREEPPDLVAIVPDLPEAVDDLIRRCLEKDPVRRFSSARDLAFALETAAKSITATSGSSRSSRRTTEKNFTFGNGARVAMLVAMLAAIVTIAVLTRGAFSGDAPEPPRLRTLTYSGRDSAPAASPDGKLIAFVSTRDGQRRIWIKQLADGTEVAVTSGPDDSAPRFARDGSTLLFTRAENGASAIHRVAAVGGEPRKLIDDAYDGDWSPDLRRIAFIRTRTGKARLSTVCVAELDTGNVRELVASAEEDYGGPRWSPDGKTIAVTRHPHSTASASVVLIEEATGETHELARDTPHGAVSAVAWSGNDTILYCELEALTGAALRRRGGGAAVVMQNVRSGDARVLLRNPHGSADTLDLAGGGRLIFCEDVTRQNLQELTTGETPHARWLSHGTSMDRQPAYTRDGQRIVFASDRGGNPDLWELTIATGALRRLTDHDAVDWDPHVAPDGALLWSSNRGGHFEVWTATRDGANPKQITSDGVDAENPTVPADGSAIYYDSSNPKSDGLWRIPRSGGAATLVVAGETIHPEVSADGMYVVYERPENGDTSAIDVVRTTDGHVFHLAQGLTFRTVRARWVGATHTIAFRTSNGIVTQDFSPDADTSATRRMLLATSDLTPETFALAPDGKHAVVSVIDEASALMIAEGIDALQ